MKMSKDVKELVRRRLEVRENERKEEALAKAEASSIFHHEIIQREAARATCASENETLESFVFPHSRMDHKQTYIRPGDRGRAKEWALERFPGGDNDGLFDSAKFHCEFLLDRMTVQPKVYGHISPLQFRFQLFRIGEQLFWVGQNHITGQIIKHEIS
jgi:hypothetical protein